MVRKRARRTNRKNPSKVGIKRDVWINAKIRVTKGGKIQAKVPASAVKSNPIERGEKYKGRMTGDVMGSRHRVPKNKRYLVGVSGNTSSYKYASKMSTAKAKGPGLARKFNSPDFFVQNQVTGSLIKFRVTYGNPKWKEYTLYPGGITFPTAVDAKAALIAARRDYPSAYVITPSGKRLKVGKGY